MNVGTITALISGLTALVGAITALVIQVQHIRNHPPATPDKPAPTGVKPSLINPPPPDFPTRLSVRNSTVSAILGPIPSRNGIPPVRESATAEAASARQRRWSRIGDGMVTHCSE